MKKNLLFSIVLLFVVSNYLSAQRLFETGNNWNLLDVIWLTARTNNYSIGTDTMVNGVSYKQVLINGVHVDINDLATPRFVRETDDGKVYVDNHIYGDTDEILIYDYGLMVGDTFVLVPSVQTNLERKFLVTSIDTVPVLHDTLRRQMTLKLIASQFESTLTWIEGIGEVNNGPFYHHAIYIFDFESVLLCAYKQDTIKVYENPKFDSCFVTITSTEEIAAIDSVKIYPNPVTKVLIVDFSAAHHNFTEISIYNTLGVSVHQQRSENNFFKIDVSQLAAGIYYVVLQDKSGVHFSHRIGIYAQNLGATT